MTQEEKARAYDEALKRARALRQEAIDKEYAIDYVKDYEAIFPELAESEDERIRKELIEAFEVYDIESSWNLIPVKHILAWLEKQKEQPFLPDNFDEAAREIVIKMHLCLKDCTILGDRLTRGELMALVKAGAEWMANIRRNKK